jgi:PmbA protein
MGAPNDELLAVADHIVALAGAGEQVEAVVVRGLDTEIKVYGGEVESLSSAQSQGAGVRVVVDGRQGFAYAGSLDPDVLLETLAEARDNARFATLDEFIGLAEPDGVEAPSLDLYRDDLASSPTDAKVALAAELERAVLGADPRITGIETAEYVDSLSEAAIATTTGLRTTSRESSCYLATYAMASDGGDDAQTGFGFSVGRRLDDLDVAAAAADAATRATRLLGARQPRSERVTVVLDPWVTAQLLGLVASTLSGEAVLKGRSLFAQRLGEQVASPLVTLVDDPTDVRAYTATETDGEGLAARRNVLLDGGVLQRFVHNAYTARRAGTSSTGNAVRGYSSTPGVGCMAVSLVPGTASQAELLAQVGEGVLIADVAGLHSGVNPVSGDFSTGAEGLRIRGGELAEPVREFTIASTLQKMLHDVRAVGADLEWLPMSAAGVSLVVGDVTVSGA